MERAQREAIDAWNRGERDEWLRYFTEDAEWIAYNALDGAEFHGHAGLVRMWDLQHEQFPDYEVRIRAMSAVGEDQLLTDLELHGIGGASGAAVRQPIAQLARFRDGKLVRIEMHGSRQAALGSLKDQ